MGSGCYAVGIVVVSNTRDLRFKSNHCQKNYLLSTVPIEKTKIKKKEAGMGPIKVVGKREWSIIQTLCNRGLCLWLC